MKHLKIISSLEFLKMALGPWLPKLSKNCGISDYRFPGQNLKTEAWSQLKIFPQKNNLIV